MLVIQCRLGGMSVSVSVYVYVCEAGTWGGGQVVSNRNTRERNG